MTERPATSTPERMDALFGTAVTPSSFKQWMEQLAGVIASGERRYLVGHHNLHSLYVLQRDPGVGEFYARCDSCYVDGVPVCWILSAAGMPTPASSRFSLMDTLPELLQQAHARNWTLYYLGSTPEVIATAREKFADRYPGLHLHHGYIEDDAAVVEEINRVRPDLLLVGMGMPLQERWLLRHIEQLDVAVATTAGATMDYYTDAQARPPGWISRIGLAGLYRLCSQPTRLWRRYLVEPWSLVRPVWRQVMARREP